MSANSASGFMASSQPMPADALKPQPNDQSSRNLGLTNLPASQDTAKFSAATEDLPENHVSKWEAAKKGMSNSWYFGIPLGLIAGGFMHYSMGHHLAELKLPSVGKAGLAVNLITGVGSSLLGWTLYGGIIGAVTAAVANHKKAKADSQQDGSDNGINPNKAFWWSTGLFGLYNAAFTGLACSGLLGEKMQKSTKSIFKTPKLMIPTVGLMALATLTLSYIAKKSATWINQKSENAPDTEQ